MLTAFTIGAKVMLLRNFVVELNLMNGAIGEVVNIFYKEEDGPRGNNIPAYVVVDFPKCSILEGSNGGSKKSVLIFLFLVLQKDVRRNAALLQQYHYEFAKL